MGHASSSGSAPGASRSASRSLDELEHQRVCAVRLLEAVDGSDVRMIQRGEDLRFASEAREAIGSRANASGSTFSATSRARLVSRAR